MSEASNWEHRRRKMKKRWIALLSSAFVTLIVLAGCTPTPTAVTFTTPY
jgi:hypothetical protein